VSHTGVVEQIDPIEERNASLHRRVADRIRRDPSIIERARARLAKCLAEEPAPDPVLIEWRDALVMLTFDEVAALLESDSPRARRLRISSPFFEPAP
jgi:hypothetical protein